MSNLPEEIQDKIYRYKHQLEFTHVLKQLVRNHYKPKIYYCFGCDDFYPMRMTCDCNSKNVNDNDYNYSYEDSDCSDSSFDNWLYCS